MNKSKFLILKILLSLILAFVFLNLFCYFYYNVPAHVRIEDGATDYKWEANKFYSRGTEGFAWGTTNNDGYNNTFDYNSDMTFDGLLMGSSHMEAFQVNMENSTAAQLNKLLGNDLIYNIGVSDHNFLVCVKNIENAVKVYKPKKYLIIETRTILLDNKKMENVINNEFKINSGNLNGITSILQNFPFLRLAYAQYKLFMKKNKTDNLNNGVNDSILINKLFQKIVNDSGDNIKVIILYHPSFNLVEGNKLDFIESEESMKEFADNANKNGIIFVNMKDIFVKTYNEEKILPYGFSNTSVGTGHLNKYGHQMVAKALYNVISEVQ